MKEKEGVCLPVKTNQSSSLSVYTVQCIEMHNSPHNLDLAIQSLFQFNSVLCKRDIWCNTQPAQLICSGCPEPPGFSGGLQTFGHCSRGQGMGPPHLENGGAGGSGGPWGCPARLGNGRRQRVLQTAREKGLLWSMWSEQRGEEGKKGRRRRDGKKGTIPLKWALAGLTAPGIGIRTLFSLYWPNSPLSGPRSHPPHTDTHCNSCQTICSHEQDIGRLL